MKLVVDTNVILVTISDKSKYHWLYKAIIDGEIELFVTNEILREYEEVVSEHLKVGAAEDMLRTLERLPNVHFIQTYFNWKLITKDPDDDKFVDCAFAGNVDYLITQDKHFNVLKKIDFPKINVICFEDFQEIYFQDKIN